MSPAEASARIEALEYRVEELERVLGMGKDDIPTIRALVGATESQAKLIGVLRKASRPVTKDVLFSAMYGGRDPDELPTMQVLDVLMLQARKALRTIGIKIDTIPRTGWVMPADDRRRLSEMMAQV